MRLISAFLSCVLIALLAACGGGGGSDAAAPSSNSSVWSPASPAPNVMAVTVELGPSSNVNIPYVTVTVCEPGSDVKCRSIEHVLVDTGSYGLAIFATALAPVSGLPTLNLVSERTSDGAILAECTKFADYSAIWGALKRADVKLANMRADAIPIHVVGDGSFAGAPSDCTQLPDQQITYQLNNNATEFGANGILGVGFLAEDCGVRCEEIVDNGYYYACSSSSCIPSIASISSQLVNPVARFATNNNGVVLKMQPIAPRGAATAAGSLIFGIGTQPNNALGEAKVFNLDPVNGRMTTIYKNRQYADSFIDSGSNAIYFDDDGIDVCTGKHEDFYCPSSTQNLTATMIGAKVDSASATSGTVSFSVAKADDLFLDNPSFVAFPTLAGRISAIDKTKPAPSWSSSFDWGLPFFYGRSVFTAIRGKDTPAGKGPYYAY